MDYSVCFGQRLFKGHESTEDLSKQNTHTTRRVQNACSSSVAAPDHKIRQCSQRSALFPGRAKIQRQQKQKH